MQIQDKVQNWNQGMTREALILAKANGTLRGLGATDQEISAIIEKFNDPDVDSLGYAKKRCHALFDRHWMDKEQKRTYRTAMYRWLAGKMNIDPENCHFGYFTREQLDEAYYFLIRVKELKMRLDKNGNAVFGSRN